MLTRTILLAISFVSITTFSPTAATAQPIISVGSPTTSVPGYLSDGSYIFGITVSLNPDQFLLPVGITGADKLQTWQFDVTFDNTVIREVDPFDGTSGIYGAEFMPGDPNTLSFILGGFPFNDFDPVGHIGLVDDIAGSYPLLFAGPTGDGILAYVLFEYLPNQQNNDPSFDISKPVTTQAIPEPVIPALMVGGLFELLVIRHRQRREGPQEH